MKTGWIVNLLLVIAVAGLVAYALYRPKEDAGGPQSAISAIPPAQVKRVRIEPQGAAPIELEKDGDEWFLVQPLRARAERSQVDRLLDLLSARSREKLAATQLERFDLDRPALKVAYDDFVIAFGTTNPLSQDQYVHAGDNVYLLPSFYRAQVPDRPERVLTHALLRQNEKPVAIRLNTFALEQREGKWVVTPAAGKEPPSQDDLNRWLDDWRHASSLLTQPATPKTAAREWIEIKLDTGGALRLGVVQPAPQLVLLRPDEKLTFHFSEETGTRLTSRPEPPPAPASGTSPAAPAQ